MTAGEKIEALTLKRVHLRAAALRPGLDLATVYRWRAALRTPRGVGDDVKRLLMAATEGSRYPIAWADFETPAPTKVAAE